MKALWIVCLGIVLGGCAVPPAESLSLSASSMVEEAAYGFTPVSTGRPQEIVGTENHKAVLDGAS
jgi:hypothetical protein